MPSAVPAVTPPARLRGRTLALLLVLCGAAFLEGIDIAMFNIALPVIRADLGLATGELQWIISAYILGYGGFMLLGGRAADLLGRRRVFLTALVVFALFSAVGGLAVDGWMLILVRIVTGIAAAFMMPAGLSIITTSFPEGGPRNRALLIYAGVGAAGFSLGLVAGGLLTLLGWRWVFFAPVALSILVLVFALPLIPRPAGGAESARAGRADLLGAVTITGALVLLVAAVEQSTHAAPAFTLTLFGAGVLLLGTFVVVERRARSPLVRLGILRSVPLLRSYLGAAMLAAGFLGFQFIVVLYLQELRGWTTLETALAMLVLGIDAIIAPLVTPRLVARFGLWRVILAGSALAAASFLLFLPVGPDWSYAAMFPSFLALGLAFAFAYGPLTIAATDDVADHEQGLAGGLLYTMFQFGGAIGLAATGAVQVAALAAEGDLLGSYRAALLVPLSAAVLGVLAAAGGIRRGRSEISPGRSRRRARSAASRERARLR